MREYLVWNGNYGNESFVGFMENGVRFLQGNAFALAEDDWDNEEISFQEEWDKLDQMNEIARSKFALRM